MKTLKLAQLNLNWRAQERRYQIYAESLQELSPDVLTVQELVDPDSFMEALKPTGLLHGEFSSYNTNDGKQHVGVLSKTPLRLVENPIAVTRESSRIVVASTMLHGKQVNVASAHFIWGGTEEARRLAQAEMVDDFMAQLEEDNPESISILGGDLNADPDSRSIRFLTGKDLNAGDSRGTFWTDAWLASGSPRNEITTRYDVSQGIASARSARVLDALSIPPRRIDYIMVKGWVYGKIGYPTNFDRITTVIPAFAASDTLSDHHGIHSDILLEY